MNSTESLQPVADVNVEIHTCLFGASRDTGPARNSAGTLTIYTLETLKHMTPAKLEVAQSCHALFCPFSHFFEVEVSPLSLHYA